MSDIVEKTLASFPKFLSESILGGNYKSGNNAPRGFHNFIKVVNSVETKYEEEQIVFREMQILQKRLSHPDISNPQLCDYLCRLVFCCMLGYDASFCHIHAVKLAQQGVGINKRIGYMSVALLLHEDHEMIVLLINTIQKDLKSSNLLDNYMALTAASQLVNAESIPLMLPLILDKLKHPRELVRARAAQCLHKMFVRAPSLLQHHTSPVQAALADKDPGVISAVLHILAILIQENPENHISLGESLIQVLQQVINRSFPVVYEYHNIPLPWLQIQLLRVLGLLGSVSESLSCQLHPILSEILHRYKIRENMAYAILYECIITITTVKPHSELLQEVSTCVARFLQSSNHNLRFLGIKALSALIGVDPVYATSHQLAVVECLDEEDEAIQRKTLMLLHGIANSSNVQAICVKLLEQLYKSGDVYFKMEIAQRIAQLADKLSPDAHWYIETMSSILPHVSSSSKIDELTAAIMNFIENNNEQFDEDFKQFLLEKYLNCLQDKTTPRPVLKLGVWVIGKTTQSLKAGQSSRVICTMLEMLSQQQTDDELCSMALSVLTTLVVQKAVSTDDSAKLLLCDNLPLTAPFLKQKLRELKQLMTVSSRLPSIHNTDRFKVRDFTLSFLDDDVAMAIENGAAPYRLKTLRQRQPDSTNSNLSAPVYESVYQQMSPAKSSSTHEHGSVASSLLSENSSTSDKAEHSSQNRSAGLNLSGVQKVWGRDGLQNTQVSDADKQTHSKSSSEASAAKEKKREKQQLAKALFEGVSKQQQAAAASKQSWFTEDCDNFGTDEQFSLPKSNSSKWRSMHHEHQSLSYHDSLDFNQSASPVISGHERLANEISSDWGARLETNNQSEQGFSDIRESERSELWVGGGISSSVQYADSAETIYTAHQLNSNGSRFQGSQKPNPTSSLYDQSEDLFDPTSQSDGVFSGLSSQSVGSQSHISSQYFDSRDSNGEADNEMVTENQTGSDRNIVKQSIYDDFTRDNG